MLRLICFRFGSAHFRPFTFFVDSLSRSLHSAPSSSDSWLAIIIDALSDADEL